MTNSINEEEIPKKTMIVRHLQTATISIKNHPSAGFDSIRDRIVTSKLLYITIFPYYVLLQQNSIGSKIAVKLELLHH